MNVFSKASEKEISEKSIVESWDICILIAKYDELMLATNVDNNYVGPAVQDSTLLEAIIIEIQNRQEKSGLKCNFETFISIKRTECINSITGNQDEKIEEETIVSDKITEVSATKEAGVDFSFNNPLVKWALIVIGGIVLIKYLQKK